MANTEISRTKRNLPPANYSVKVDSYTFLSELVPEKYDTIVFEAGGYKWRLSFYPNGDKKNNGNNHISLYLAIVETDTFCSGWEVNVNFKLFLYDQINDKYLTVQDIANEGVKRFHEMKKEWGFAQFLPLETFKNSSNGYLIDDSFVFGVEIFVMKYTGIRESISMVKEPKDGTFTWEIQNFSNLNQSYYYSQAFKVEGITWQLLVYPNGSKNAKNKSFSIFLELGDCGKNPINNKLYVEYKLRVLDQVNGKHVERKVDKWFNNKKGSDQYGFSWGFTDFMSWMDVRDPSKGFIVKDSLIVEVVFLIISVSKGKIKNIIKK